MPVVIVAFPSLILVRRPAVLACSSVPRDQIYSWVHWDRTLNPLVGWALWLVILVVLLYWRFEYISVAPSSFLSLSCVPFSSNYIVGLSKNVRI